MRILPLLFISTIYLSSETYISNSVITNSTIGGDNYKNISNSIITNSTIGNSHIGVSITPNSTSNLTKKKFSIEDDFSKISLNLAAKFIIESNSSENSIEIKIDKKFINSIDFHVINKQLEINSISNIISSSPITITIHSCNGLSNISSTGANKIKINGLYEKNLNLNISGVNTIKFGDGQIDELNIYAKGHYKLDLKKIQSNKASITAKGVGKIKLAVKNYLDVSLSGVIKVYYKGNPKINKSISYLSKLKKR